jgi:hypothetical protein
MEISVKSTYDQLAQTFSGLRTRRGTLDQSLAAQHG